MCFTQSEQLPDNKEQNVNSYVLYLKQTNPLNWISTERLETIF